MNELGLDFAATAKPFASVVLCFTGVDHDERTVLVNHAQQMGAVSKADLRSDVTHMVVGNVNTPKYQFAAQNRFDLKIMDLKWIEAAYEKWIQGEDVNFEETVTSHILPPLYGLKICLTNVASQDERKLIESQIRSNGGDYHPDLSKQCTHLLCASKTGKKYEAALKWSIQCVGIEWLFESIERGMALDAKYFKLDIEPENRGKGAWDRNAALKLSGPSGLMELSFDTTAPIETDNGTRKRRLRRAGSQIAQQGIWEGILGGVTDAQAAHQNLPAIDATNVEEDFHQLPISIVEEPSVEGFNMDCGNPEPGLFEDMIFYTWGFTDKQREVLADVITKNQGLMFTKPLPGSTHDASRSFTLIPSTVPREEAPLGYGGSEVVTEMWIERCIAASSTFNPGEMVMCKPMPGPFPRLYLQNIAISITGFSGPDLLHIERLLNLLGAHYYSNLTRKRSLLLTPDTQMAGPKMLKAKEWGIPVVNVGWLWEVIARGPENVDIGMWSDRQVDLVRYTPGEASSNLKAVCGNTASCPPAVGETIHTVLDGCVIYVSKKLEGLAPELHSMAESLGAQVTKTFDSTQLTHMIHQSSRLSETFREFHLARTANIHIVHPQWLYQCRSSGMRCGEDAWTWMWNADKSLAVIGTSEPNTPLESRREKRLRQDENIPPDKATYSNESVKLEQVAKLLGNVSSPQRKTKRRLAGRAQNTQISTTPSSIASPGDIFTQIDEEEGPRPTQEKVEYKDPVAERERAKIVANLLGITEEERMAQIQSSSMTPAEDIGRRGSTRKSARK